MYGSMATINILLFYCGDRLQSQILTYKVGPRAERVIAVILLTMTYQMFWQIVQVIPG